MRQIDGFVVFENLPDVAARLAVDLDRPGRDAADRHADCAEMIPLIHAAPAADKQTLVGHQLGQPLGTIGIESGLGGLRQLHLLLLTLRIGRSQRLGGLWIDPPRGGEIVERHVRPARSFLVHDRQENLFSDIRRGVPGDALHHLMFVTARLEDLRPVLGAKRDIGILLLAAADEKRDCRPF